MKLFLSGEIENKAYEDYHVISRLVEEKLPFVCDRVLNLEKEDNYGKEFELIGIICIIVPIRMIEAGRKERKLIKWKDKEADIRLYIDYEKFINSSFEVQRLMYVKNIMDSIEVIISRSKGDFKGEKLKQDILDALELTYDDLKDI